AVPLVAGNSYQWYKGVAAISGQTSNAYPTNITGNYKVTVTGSNGCSKSSSVLKLSVYKPSIQAFGPTTFCNGGNVVLGISSGTTNSWQWIKNNVNISGANNQYYVATKTGYYKAATTNSNGCTGVSANIVVTVNCREGEIENEFNTKLQAYPNPINDRVTIEGAAISAEGTIDVFDITGRKVDVDIESIQDGMATLNCSTLNDGIYILNFVKELGTIETIKLIKQ
ncbi:MAG TPA: T9SS type A sorting domain-containing protein, partial [Bacteroidia bacterium]|nr:T9SS type A sorting domain-containing protein [Bacteroidia bacterium]